MIRRAVRLLLSVVMLAAAALLGTVATAGPAQADSCYSWGRTLSQGMSGSDVRQLQIRVSGYPGYGNVLAIDGDYGPATAAAVTRFQSAYGLSADGVAGTQTFQKIYALQDGDCTPKHFAYSELNHCNSSWGGGAVSAGTAKSHALRTMWKLEALRHALGDDPIVITSGFRSYPCNSAVGGASASRHLYGDAADMVSHYHSFCSLAKQARYRGFRGILGPGFPGHSDHVHVDYRSSRYWSASQCGI